MKKHLSTLLIVCVFVVGLLVMLYPTISNWYNQRVGSYAIANYADAVDMVDHAAYDQMMQDAAAYNSALHAADSHYISGAAYDPAYISCLDVLDGMMGYVVIDSIGVSLPIYHGTDESVLQSAVGHYEGSSLPTGQLGNHTVLTGHTGYASATLFTNLDQLVVGDTFQVIVLGEVFTYEVYNIAVVEPQALDALATVDGKDIVTLVTCTPYGVNSHRLLVQGEQIASESLWDTAEADVPNTDIVIGTDTATDTGTQSDTLVLFGVAVGNVAEYPIVVKAALALCAVFVVVLLLPRRRKRAAKPKHAPKHYDAKVNRAAKHYKR